MMHLLLKLIVVLILHPPNHGEYDLTTDDVRKVTSGIWLNDKVSEILTIAKCMHREISYAHSREYQLASYQLLFTTSESRRM